MNHTHAKHEGISWLDFCLKIKPDITEDEVNYLLWNETCYPFDDVTTCNQLEKILTELKSPTP